MSEKQSYLKGLYVKSPNAKAPEFVLGRIAIQVDVLAETLKNTSEDWINLDIKRGKDGEIYATINTFKPASTAPAVRETEAPEAADRDLPF